MKGREQGACAGCLTKKGDRDRNAGWYNLTPRGSVLKTMLFCPACAAALLVGLDERLGESKKGNPNLRAVLVGDLERLASAVMTGDLRHAVCIIERMVPDACVQRGPRGRAPTARAS